MLSSLVGLLKVGPGPSSSHTIGPHMAALDFAKGLNEADKVIITLFGSLALTGQGHMTDKILRGDFPGIEVEIRHDINTEVPHPNTLSFKAFHKSKEVLCKTYVSVGGGEIRLLEKLNEPLAEVYPFNNFKELESYLDKENLSPLGLVERFEGRIAVSYLEDIYKTMVRCISRGLEASGEVAGRLHLKRVAKEIYKEAEISEDEQDKQRLYISAYAYAVSEENAGGGEIVTAPTCGSAGVLPSLLYYCEHHLHKPHQDIIEGLALAGLIGLIIKKNATISGAVGGCQAEIGSACAMAAGALSYIDGLSLNRCEFAAEIGMEHSLGLTCDPIGGYVAIPCIERNAIAALKSYDAFVFSKYISKFRYNRVSLDEVIQVMYETGLALNKDYKETAIGGLAHLHKC